MNLTRMMVVPLEVVARDGSEWFEEIVVKDKVGFGSPSYPLKSYTSCKYPSS